MKRFTRVRRYRQALLVVGLLTALAIVPASAQQIPVQQVRFAKGSDQATVRGALSGRGPDAQDYIVSVKAGQTLSAELVTKSPETYFNVMAPDSVEVPFVGEMEAKQSWQAQLNRSGNYTIRVYLNSAASRRGASSSYTLNIAVR